MATARPPLAPSLLVLALLAAPDAAQAQPGPSGAGPGGPSLDASGTAGMRVQGATGPMSEVAIRRENSRTPGEIQVRSPQIRSQAPIPSRHTAYGDDISPELQWNPVDGARSYALLVEDPDAPTAQPFVHWLVWNIPPDHHGLPEAIETVGEPLDVKGIRQGRNDRGEVGYFGPRPPAGDGPHRYHFLVFALDRGLDLPAGATRDELLDAIDGHVLAKGELVATSQAPRAQ
jgi:Raf kinase inhibitor-like YbhB/YbcL family protein